MKLSPKLPLAKRESQTGKQIHDNNSFSMMFRVLALSLVALLVPTAVLCDEMQPVNAMAEAEPQDEDSEASSLVEDDGELNDEESAEMIEEQGQQGEEGNEDVSDDGEEEQEGKSEEAEASDDGEEGGDDRKFICLVLALTLFFFRKVGSSIL